MNILLAIVPFVAVHAVFCEEEEFECPRSRGYFPHPKECKKYYSCRKRVSTLRECPERMLFDEKKGNCYIQSAVDCGKRTKPTVTVVTMTEVQEHNKVTTEIEWNTRTYTATETSESSTQENVESSDEFTHTVTDNLTDDKDIIIESTSLPEKEFTSTEIVEDMSISVSTNKQGGTILDISTTSKQFTDGESITEETNMLSSHQSELPTKSSGHNQESTTYTMTEDLSRTSGYFTTQENLEYSSHVYKEITDSTLKDLTTYDVSKIDTSSNGGNQDSERTDGTSVMEETSRSELPAKSTGDNQESIAYSTMTEDLSRTSESHFTTQENLEYSILSTSSNGGNQDSESTGGTSIMEETSIPELPTKSTGDNQESIAYSTMTEDFTRMSESYFTTQENLENSSQIYKETTSSTLQDLITYDVSKLNTSPNGGSSSQEAFSTKVTENYSIVSPSNKSDFSASEETVTNISTTLSNEQTDVANGTIPTTFTSLPKSTQSSQSSGVTTDKTAVVTDQW